MYPAAARSSVDGAAVVDLPGGAIATPRPAPRLRPVVGNHFNAEQIGVIDQPFDDGFDVFADAVADVDGAAGLAS